MKIAAQELLHDLAERTRLNITEAAGLLEMDEKSLNFKSSANSWSILECIEHLNLYGDFYIPEIQKRIASGRKSSPSNFKSGLLGNYFAKMMLPGTKPMKTFADKNPAGSKLNKSVINKFLEQQNIMLNILDAAQKVDLTKTKTAISISKWIKLRLGDTLRVVIYHNQRHLVQAYKVKSAQNVLIKNN